MIKPTYRTFTTVELFTNPSNFQSNKLRERLFTDHIKDRRCEVCKRIKWNGKTIPLELEHTDGNKYNNCLENLRILCPNCHAQTPTYRGKNVGTYRARAEIGKQDGLKPRCE